MYLYRAVDSKGNTIDFHLSKKEIIGLQSFFFKKTLQSFHVPKPCVITVDKNPAYSIEIEELKKEKKKKMPVGIQIRHIKYLNNIVEQIIVLLKREFVQCWD